MKLRPVTQRAARAWIEEHHRHSGAPRGDVFRVAITVDDEIVGIGMAGRPVARGLDDGHTLEILRICTLGHENACSVLYGALCRAGKALGWDKAITYTLAEESGASLRASGFIAVAELPARPSWSTPSRKRSDAIKRPAGPKVRWERNLQ